MREEGKVREDWKKTKPADGRMNKETDPKRKEKEGGHDVTWLVQARGTCFGKRRAATFWQGSRSKYQTSTTTSAIDVRAVTEPVRTATADCYGGCGQRTAGDPQSRID